MNTVTLTQEELDQLKEVKGRAEQLTAELGALSTQKLRLSIIEDSLKQEMISVMTKEESLSKELLEKYGPISIDLEQGTATTVSA